MTSSVTTPDGVLRVEFASVEMRMSHTVNNPRVVHVPTGRVVLDRFDTLWDATPRIDHRGRLHLDMREYPGDTPGHELVFDVPAGVCRRIDASGNTESWPLESMIEHRAEGESALSGEAQSDLVLAVAGADSTRESDHDSAVLELPLPADLAGPDTPASGSSIFVTAPPPRERHHPPRRRSNVPRAVAMGFASVFAIVALFAVAWALATRTPLDRLPPWAGWGISVFIASLLTLAATSLAAAIGDVRRTGRG